VKKDNMKKNAFSDIKALIFAILGIDPKDAGQPKEKPALHAQAADLVRAACDPEYAARLGLDPNALLDLPVRLETFAKPTRPTPEKPSGGVFTVHRWYPVEGVRNAAT